MKPTLTDIQQQQMKEAFTNPSNSLSDAWFYAGMTGQNDACSTLQKAIDEIASLGESLATDGLITEAEIYESGYAGKTFQQLAEKRQAEDPRFAQINELAKKRFLIDVADHETNTAMVTRVESEGRPDEIGLAWNHDHLARMTKPGTSN